MDYKDIVRHSIILSILTTLLTVLVVGIVLLMWIKYSPHTFSQITNLSPLQSAQTNNTSKQPLYSFESVVVDAVKKANPAVVAITISKDVPVYERYFQSIPSPFGSGTFRFTIPQIRQRGFEKREVGGGSGFLVSSDGYIVTNRHVVEDTNAEYAVFLNDGKKYNARVITRDTTLDLAVIKIEGVGFSYLPFGDSDKIQVGQTVIAIGNALAEFRNTVSLGIVSGLSRSIVASDRRGNEEFLGELIQTDAAINQGNSGGPLLNLAGEVIGVNVAVVSGAENIGFAISGNSVKSIIESIRKE